MANQTFDSVILNQLERPLSSDLNAAQSDSHRDLRDYLNRALAYPIGGSPYESTGLQAPGFIGDGFRVVPQAPAVMGVSITPGMAFVPNPAPQANLGAPPILGLNDLSPYSPILLSGAQTFTVPAAPGVGTRIDLIEVRVDRRLTDVTSRDIFNPGTLTFGPQNVAKTLSFDTLGDTQTVLAPAVGSAGLVYKQGVVGGGVPATDPGYYALAHVIVASGTTSITPLQIADFRPLAAQGGVLSLAASCQFGSQMTGTGSAKVAAPPGVKVALICEAAPAPAQYIDVYVFLGDTAKYDLAGMSADFGTANLFDTPAANDAMISGSRASGTVNSVEQTILRGADPAYNAILPVQVGVGTPYIRQRFTFGKRTITMSAITQMRATNANSPRMEGDVPIGGDWLAITPGNSEADLVTFQDQPVPLGFGFELLNVTMTGGVTSLGFDSTQLSSASTRRFSVNMSFVRIAA